MKRSIKILLLDDHTLFRESLHRLLQAESAFQVVGTSATVAEGLRLLGQKNPTETPDVVLLDFDLGDDHGLSFLTQARAAGFGGAVLMVTAGVGDADVLRLLQAGASGIFLKHSPPSRLVEAIHRVAAGETWLDQRVMHAALATAQQPPQATRSPAPSGRAQQVLQGVLDGLCNKEIASRLEISESSVKATLQQLFDQNGVRTRSQLVRIALEKHPSDWLK